MHILIFNSYFMVLYFTVLYTVKYAYCPIVRDWWKEEDGTGIHVSFYKTTPLLDSIELRCVGDPSQPLRLTQSTLVISQSTNDGGSTRTMVNVKVNCGVVVYCCMFGTSKKVCQMNEQRVTVFCCDGWWGKALLLVAAGCSIRIRLLNSSLLSILLRLTKRIIRGYIGNYTPMHVQTA